MKYTFIFSVFLFLTYSFTSAQEVLVIENNQKKNIGTSLEILEDPTGLLTINDVIKNRSFTKSNTNVPNLGISNNSYWIKFSILNRSNESNILVQLGLATIDEVNFYSIRNNTIDSVKTGDFSLFSSRIIPRPDFCFKVTIPKGDTSTVFLKLKGGEQLQAPINIGVAEIVSNDFYDADLIMGIYFGIILVMLLYNIFIYYSTKDNSYLLYVVYITIVGLTQLNFQGYTYKYLWPHSILFSKHAVYIFSILVAIASAEFMKSFLLTKFYTPKLHRLFPVFYGIYLISFICLLLNELNLSYQIIQFNAMFTAMFMLYVAWKVTQKDFRPAKIFLLAWSIFLIGVCIYVLKDKGILPYNTITYYMMPFGSAIEVILLSFALADKINILKKEKEKSQEEVFEALQENEKLIKEQNIILEKKVSERTYELNTANKELSTTLKNLKDTQAQLVDAEKMASLGQLTAGIAHEINNPINFVSANVKPLQLDIDDILSLIHKYENLNPNEDLDLQLKDIDKYKKQIDLAYLQEEIKTLLHGISDGAYRTAEIVKGLRNFSRLDEGDIKTANLNEGIESTLTILRSAMPENIKVLLQLGDIPAIECFPGKLNQVFMNAINNSVHAMQKNLSRHDHLLTITTFMSEHSVSVCIEDTGTGMTEVVKQKIFEPFFTTKDVGEGTGLGMSIVFKIIESHGGTIDVQSELNKGTKITFTLPKKLIIS